MSDVTTSATHSARLPVQFQLNMPANALLLLADGSVFYGYGFGKVGMAQGEICFNTGMSGYQEVLTDPSYTGQVVVFTFPHIGNVGCNDEDVESAFTGATGLVVREDITEPSNFRSGAHLHAWAQQHGVVGISGVDTRALTRAIRRNGAQNCLIYVAGEHALPDIQTLQSYFAEMPSLAGLELAESVTTKESYHWKQQRWNLDAGYPTLGEGKYHVVAIDFGEKFNILRSLAQRDCDVSVVPASTSAREILAMKPDGVFLSNGPGDPSATAAYASSVIRALVESDVPVFGICLGHQLLALALQARTEKMHQGHRGVNHPVKNLATGKVEITSQNHGFVVVDDSLPECLEVTHISLFDGTIEGLRHKHKPVFSVQYHPESSPGPHDSQYLFDDFVALMCARKAA